MPFSVRSIVEGALGPVTGLIDDLFTSEEEKQNAKRLMQEVRQQMQSKLLDVRSQLIEQRGAAVTAEAQGESWLQRSWRPITMLVLVTAIMLHWLGLAGTELAPAVQQEVYSLIKLGLGGYVIGRSSEKIAGRWQAGKRADQGRAEAERDTEKERRLREIRSRVPDETLPG